MNISNKNKNDGKNIVMNTNFFFIFTTIIYYYNCTNKLATFISFTIIAIIIIIKFDNVINLLPYFYFITEQLKDIIYNNLLTGIKTVLPYLSQCEKTIDIILNYIVSKDSLTLTISDTLDIFC